MDTAADMDPECMKLCSSFMEQFKLGVFEDDNTSPQKKSKKLSNLHPLYKKLGSGRFKKYVRLEGGGVPQKANKKEHFL